MTNEETLTINLTVLDRCTLTNMLPTMCNNIHLASDVNLIRTELVDIPDQYLHDWCIFKDTSGKYICAPWKENTLTSWTLNKAKCIAFKTVIQDWQMKGSINPRYASIFLQVINAADNDDPISGN